MRKLHSGQDSLGGRGFRDGRGSQSSLVSYGDEGSHIVHPVSRELPPCPPSSDSATGKGHRQRGSHSIAAALHQTGYDAEGHQLWEVKVRSLLNPPSTPSGSPGDLRPSPCPRAESVAAEGPVEGLRGGVGRHGDGQQCLALLHRGHHKHLLPQELWRVCGRGGPAGSQDY